MDSQIQSSLIINDLWLFTKVGKKNKYILPHVSGQGNWLVVQYLRG